MKKIEHYIKDIIKLRVASSKGEKAPHKPVLLLSVIEAVETGEITDNKILITPELVARFKSNWSILVKSDVFTANFALPFFHLKNEKGNFWHLHPQQGYEKSLSVAKSIGSLGVLTANVAYAEIEQAFFDYLQDDSTCIEIRHALLSTYFIDTQANYYAKNSQQNAYLEDIENQVKEKPEQYIINQEELEEEEVFVRSGTFKKVIPRIYNYTCCVSGLKIITLFDAQFVDACHIIPFSKSGNDTVSNGISLSPTLHRAFDRGLFTVDEDYKIIVSSIFSESGNTQYGLKQFHGQKIILPDNELFYPDIRNFGWHRKNTFKKNH